MADPVIRIHKKKGRLMTATKSNPSLFILNLLSTFLCGLHRVCSHIVTGKDLFTRAEHLSRGIHIYLFLLKDAGLTRQGTTNLMIKKTETNSLNTEENINQIF